MQTPRRDFEVVQPKEIGDDPQQYRFVDLKAEEEARIDRDNERWQEDKEDLRQDREERKRYADRIYRLVWQWLGLVLLIVVGHGFGGVVFNLPEIVLATLVGTTTGSVLGLFWVVSRYLFPDRSSPTSRRDQ